MELFKPVEQRIRASVAKDEWNTILSKVTEEKLALALDPKPASHKGCNCGEEHRIFEEVYLCKKCGLLLEKGFDHGAEYRYFANEDRGADPCRIGPPIDHRLPESSLGTVILGGRANNKAMYRIRKFHTWNSMPYKERSLLQVYERLQLIATNNGLGASVLEDVKDMFMKIHELCDRRGLSRDAILASCTYLVLKNANSPRKHTEIAEMFSISTTTFTKALKYSLEVLTVAQAKKQSALPVIEMKTQSSTTHAEDYVNVPLSKLALPRHLKESIESACCRVCRAAEEKNISVENIPPSLAAGVIAFVIFRQKDINITIQNIAEVCNISVATLQKCLRRLEAANTILEPYIIGPQ
jgi:transcription initiation factor TFIIB